MRFASEDVRHAFHSLPAAEQFEWVALDESLAQRSEMLYIVEVFLNESPRTSVRALALGADGQIKDNHLDLLEE